MITTSIEVKPDKGSKVKVVAVMPLFCGERGLIETYAERLDLKLWVAGSAPVPEYSVGRVRWSRLTQAYLSEHDYRVSALREFAWVEAR